MGKYATGRTPDMTNNFFLMQDLDLALFHEVSELVWAATYDAALHVRVMKRITDAAYAFDNITNSYDGRSGGEISYNWLPVCFYMAVTRGGEIDQYNGFRVLVQCVGVPNAIEIFFAKEETYGQTGVWGRSELGGWSNRLPKTIPPDRPVADEPRQIEQYVVWNSTRTEGFVTLDKQLAYETRKCATTNLFDEMGNPSPVAAAFCEKWGDEDLVTEAQMVRDTLEELTGQGLENLFQFYISGHEGGKFIWIKEKRDRNPMIHALMLLNEIAPLIGENGPELMPLDPNTKSYLNHDYELFLKNAKREHVLELVRCGVRFDAGAALFDVGQGNNKEKK